MPCVYSMTLITDDIKMNRRTATWNIFVRLTHSQYYLCFTRKCSSVHHAVAKMICPSHGLNLINFSVNITNRSYHSLPTVTNWKTRKMLWTVNPCLFLFASFFMDRVSAGKQCREERSISGMALQGFILKKFFVRALHECDISCETEITCQSYNYVLGEKFCELNSRTKEARPENFRSDPTRFYKRRLSDRGM